MLTAATVNQPEQEQQVSVVSRLGSNTVKFIMNYRSLVSFNHFRQPTTAADALYLAQTNLVEYMSFYIGNALLTALILMPFQFVLSSTIYGLMLAHLYSQCGATPSETAFNRIGLFTVYTYVYIGLLIFDQAVAVAVFYALTMATFSFFHAACLQPPTTQTTTENVV
jgi:hypothetical protein